MFQFGELQFQIITFLLEFAGLSLAFIEVRMPESAARIARFMGTLAAPIEDLRKRADQGPEAYERLSSSLGRLLNIVLTLGTLPLILVFVVKASEAYLNGTLNAAWIAPQLIEFVVQLVVITLGLLFLCLVMYFTVVGGSDFATRFVEGRAVGTLGILLAATGFVMELYQLTSAF